ncbi:DegT/DnrJ/EryC1/StrS family aminotransferase [bacterium]|nr:DegT/DnrJ/EryC1/StrS family aminotransferase [bacterium]
MTEIRTIPFGRPIIGEEERNAVMRILQGHILTHGPECHQFEEEFSEFMGLPAHSVSMSSGMAALHMSYFHLGISPGDEVIVPAQTHNATVHAVEIMGAKPVFVDCVLDTGNIDPEKIDAAITERTKAIGLVHFLGIPANMDSIMEIAGRHNLKVVEDCALAVGARVEGRHVGLIGDMGIYSFYPVKHITTAEGGMFVSKHESTAKSVASKRAFGVDRTFNERKIPGLYDVVELGLNYRMSELQAAIGRVQITRLPDILTSRKQNFQYLKTQLQNIDGISHILDSNNPDIESSHYCLSILLADSIANERDNIVLELKEAGVGTSIYYPHPVPRLSYYRAKYGYREGDYPNATRISDHSIALPVGPHLERDDLDYILECVSDVIKRVKS